MLVVTIVVIVLVVTIVVIGMRRVMLGDHWLAMGILREGEELGGDGNAEGDGTGVRRVDVISIVSHEERIRI